MTAAVAETALAQLGANQETAPPANALQFARGFDGMAVAPFPEDARRVLAEPVSPHDVEIKPDGIVYLPGVAYRRILTRAFGAGGWAIAPRSPARYMKDNNIVVYHGALYCLGRFVSEAVGECFYRDNNPNMSYASCVEGAKTDAISRCCKDLGVAAELWDATWREQWKARYAVSYESLDKRSGDKKTKWKLKGRVSNPHDLMAGAGGVAPPAAAAGTPPSSPPSESPASPSSGGATTAPASDAAPAEEPTAPDTGEAATDEQKNALRNHIREMKWKKGYARQWFHGLFGLGLQIDDPLEALTQRQADAAYYLLLAHGKPIYDKLLADERAKGNVVPA